MCHKLLLVNMINYEHELPRDCLSVDTYLLRLDVTLQEISVKCNIYGLDNTEYENTRSNGLFGLIKCNYM